MLIKARQSAGEIEQIISDLKSHIESLRNEESELTKTLEQLKRELKELDEKRTKVSNENDLLKNH